MPKWLELLPVLRFRSADFRHFQKEGVRNELMEENTYSLQAEVRSNAWHFLYTFSSLSEIDIGAIVYFSL